MGKVYFVGAGSGDPELLTLKGKRLLETADVIIYDRLVHPIFLHLAKEEARFIFSGKYPKNHVLKQKNINELLKEECRKDQLIVRLKGGDPSIFGRVGEEIAVLREQGAVYEVVPGITAASAASSYSGISLTHREHSSKVTFVTAHRKQGEQLDFKGLTEKGTVCLYMGVEYAAETQQKLMEQNVSAELPVAIIEWGTMGRQRTFTTNILQMIDCIAQNQVKNPSMIVVGNVVSERKGPDWFEQKPLFGKRLLLVDTKKICFETILEYTEQGADVYAVQVGEERDRRFDEVDRQYLKDYTFDEVVYLSKQVTEINKKHFQYL
ncbi:uroporphyrinogen-III C-methyltransferase [Enterococcus sp. BWB1-3]|uniref:uroporphyrinogen-III C-methyltransferase n=1 Tax=Enterococcus sp. BWB1-3 TaxID=2787713 RepID=UPI001920A9AA|nr:uroporphyrinogen-III C-methyltransferase [Enterococcus sp. BWB1-3]MBL1228854.1 uroporphyrinogen-III C-methyltransferase [Enterococcus sp. BWB1-3]